MHCLKCGAKLLQLFDITKDFPRFFVFSGSKTASWHLLLPAIRQTKSLIVGRKDNSFFNHTTLCDTNLCDTMLCKHNTSYNILRWGRVSQTYCTQARGNRRVTTGLNVFLLTHDHWWATRDLFTSLPCRHTRPP